jgi:eukaryotic-like serine/threonine-protein kinase
MAASLAVAQPAHRPHKVFKAEPVVENIGPYRISQQLGEGAFGVVFQAYQPFLDRQVAVKTLQNLFMDDSKHEQQFMSEARTIARLRHPNIVTVYEFGTVPAEGKPLTYMVMEHLPGETLQRRMAEKKLSLVEIVTIAEQLADGLDYAHTHNVVHRDLKPANILFTDSGQPVIVDFGLARLVELGAGAESSQAGVLESTLSGTAAYMAPEQAAGEPVGPAADQYALATMVYQMLSGCLPFEGPNFTDLITQRVQQASIPLRKVAPHYSEEAETALNRALARDPAQRYPTTKAFVSELGDALLPDYQRGQVVRVVDPAQAAALKAARQTLRGFLWGIVALTVVTTALVWSLFIRGYVAGTPAFLSDGVAVPPERNAAGLRPVIGLWSGGPADKAGVQIGDLLTEDLEADQRDEDGKFTINGMERSIFGANWQPQLGDVIQRTVFRNGQPVEIAYALERSGERLTLWGLLLLPVVLSFGCALWVLRRWGDEPNAQLFALLLLAQSFTITALGVSAVLPGLPHVTYYVLFPALLHFTLIFPTPIRYLQRHPRHVWLLYLPLPLALFQFLTGWQFRIGNFDANYFVYAIYIGALITADIFKGLLRDTRRYPSSWWLMFAKWVMASTGGLAVFLALQRTSSQRMLPNAQDMVLLLYISLAVGTSIFVLFYVIGFHRLQRSIGPSLVTQDSRFGSRK